MFLQLFFMATGATWFHKAPDNVHRTLAATTFGLGLVPYFIYNEKFMMRAAVQAVQYIHSPLTNTASFLFKESGLALNFAFNNFFYTLVGSGVSYASWQFVRNNFDLQDKLDQASLRKGGEKLSWSGSQSIKTIMTLAPVFAVMAASSPFITAGVLGVAAAGKMMTRYSEGKPVFDRTTIPLLFGAATALMVGPAIFVSGLPLIKISIIAAVWSVIDSNVSILPITTAHALKRMEAENKQLQANAANTITDAIAGVKALDPTINNQNIANVNEKLAALTESLAVLGEISNKNSNENKLRKVLVPIITTKYCKQHLTGFSSDQQQKIAAYLSTKFLTGSTPQATNAYNNINQNLIDLSAGVGANNPIAGLNGNPSAQNASVLAKAASSYFNTNNNATMDDFIKSNNNYVKDALKGGHGNADLNNSEKSKLTKMYDAVVAGIDGKAQEKEAKLAAQKAAAKAKAKGI